MRYSTQILHSFVFLLIFSIAFAVQKRADTGMTINAELSQSFAFEQLTIEHGLPHNTVRSILQDSQGFLWFGTLDGLARYDGYHFKIYRHNLADSTTISSNNIKVIFEDRSQNLWIGTYYGLNKFDRSTETFMRYTQGPEESLGSSACEVWAIHEDRAGNLWVGYWAGDYLPWGGLYKLDRTIGEFTPYRYDPYNPNSMSHNSIRCIVEDNDGVLWVGTETEGLNKFDPKTETFMHYRHDPQNPRSLGDNRVWDGLKDREGNLWFAAMGAGLSKYDSSSDAFISYAPDPNNTSSKYQFTDVYKVYQDTRGMIWLSNGVLSRFDPATASFTHFRFSPNQKDWDSNYHAFAIQEDNAGNLWVGTRGSGAFKIDLKPQRFTHYRHRPENPNSLSDDDVRLIFEDTQGAIWIATRDQGLSRLDPKTGLFANFKYDPQDARSLSSDVIYAIDEDRSGNIWFGTQKELNRFDPQQGKFTRYGHHPTNRRSLRHDAINALFVDHADTLWIGMTGEGGFGKFDWRTETFQQYNPVPENKGRYYVDRFFEDRQGNLWIGTTGRVFLLDRHTGQCRAIKAASNRPRHSGGSAQRLLEDHNGTIWGWWRGLYKVDIDSLMFINYPMLETAGNQFTFNAFYNQVEATYLDAKNKIWCGTRYGLYKFDPLQEQYTARYYEKDGLSNNLITKIVADHAGRLWLLTGGGVSIFDETTPPGAQFTNLGPNDGVTNTPSAPEAFIRTRNGEVYWGGTNGVYRFYPEVQSTNPHPPQIRLTEFRKFNQPVKLDSSISTTRALRLHHDENFFSLAFAAMDFTNSKRNQYAYKLEGFDQDWIQSGNKNEASYTNVPPGTYTFRVKGSNNDGVWNEAGASVQIIITPPFWQTWWFRLAAALAVIAALTALYNYRVSKLLEIERTRLRIARDLHDEIGSSLSSIALSGELLQGKTVLDEKSKDLILRMGRTARQLTESVNELVWTFNPGNDRLDNLLLRMRDAAAEMLALKEITVAFDFPHERLPQAIAMDFRRNLFLIYKELLHNIVKHSQATRVEISLAKQDGVLTLKVTDNGIGFNPASTNGRGNGLTNMKDRAAKLGGRLQLQSLPQGGTEAVLAVKIAKGRSRTWAKRFYKF